MTSIEGPVVLVVGGWSPGPLVYLDSVVASRSCIVVEPRTLPMPPFPSGSWCCHPRMLMSIAVCGVFLWLACIQHDSILWKFLAILATLVSFRMMAAVAVRTSIQVAAQSCLEAIRSYNENAVVLVGFSWGGAVIAELLAQHKLGDHPNALLIAPTTALVSSIAMRSDTAFQVPCNNQVHVVHGTQNLLFCPNQARWTGENLHRIRDNHVFFQQSSQRLLKDLLARLLDKAMENRV